MKPNNLRRCSLILLLLFAHQATLNALEFSHNGIKSGSIKSEPNKIIYTAQTQQFYGSSELEKATVSGNIIIQTQNGISNETLGNKSIYLAIIGGTTITLPPATNNPGLIYTIKKANFNVAANTIQTQNNETIDGNTTATLTSPQEAVTLISDGSNWHIINRYATHGSITRRFNDTAVYVIKTDQFDPIYTQTIPAGIPKGLYKIEWFYEDLRSGLVIANVEHHIRANNTLLGFSNRVEGSNIGDTGTRILSGFGYATLEGDGTDTLTIILRYEVGTNLATVDNSQIRRVGFNITLIEPSL